MEYYLQNKVQSKSNVASAEKLKGLAEILSSSYDKLKQLALKATVRKPQLLLYSLALQTYKYYMELIAQIQQLENKVLLPFKGEYYSGEWRVIPFTPANKFDNTDEIFTQCKRLRLLIQDAYSELLKNDFISEEQKKFTRIPAQRPAFIFFKISREWLSEKYSYERSTKRKSRIILIWFFLYSLPINI